MATKRAITPRPAALVRLAGALAPAAAVEAVLDGRPDDAEPDDAEPDDGDNGAARRRDAVVAEAVAEIQRAALAAIRAGDVQGRGTDTDVKAFVEALSPPPAPGACDRWPSDCAALGGGGARRERRRAGVPRRSGSLRSRSRR